MVNEGSHSVVAPPVPLVVNNIRHLGSSVINTRISSYKSHTTRVVHGPHERPGHQLKMHPSQVTCAALNWKLPLLYVFLLKVRRTASHY